MKGIFIIYIQSDNLIYHIMTYLRFPVPPFEMPPSKTQCTVKYVHQQVHLVQPAVHVDVRKKRKYIFKQEFHHIQVQSVIETLWFVFIPSSSVKTHRLRRQDAAQCLYWSLRASYLLIPDPALHHEGSLLWLREK